MSDKITIEWRMPQGSGGVAAAMAHAQLRSLLNQIAKQHGFKISLYTTDERYKVRADLTTQQLSILSLQWQTDRDYLKWRLISKL